MLHVGVICYAAVITRTRREGEGTVDREAWKGRECWPWQLGGRWRRRRWRWKRKKTKVMGSEKRERQIKHWWSPTFLFRLAFLIFSGPWQQGNSLLSSLMFHPLVLLKSLLTSLHLDTQFIWGREERSCLLFQLPFYPFLSQQNPYRMHTPLCSMRKRTTCTPVALEAARHLWGGRQSPSALLSFPVTVSMWIWTSSKYQHLDLYSFCVKPEKQDWRKSSEGGLRCLGGLSGHVDNIASSWVMLTDVLTTETVALKIKSSSNDDWSPATWWRISRT